MAIDKQFVTVLQYLRAAQGQIAQGTFGGGQRPWLDFLPLGAIGKFDPLGQHTAWFDRADSNQSYQTANTLPAAPAKNLQTAKLSGDLLGSIERDYHARCRSRVRMFVHAGGQAEAHAQATGPLTRHTLRWLQNLETDKPVGSA